MADIFGFGAGGGADDPSNDVSARIPIGSSGMTGFGGGFPGFFGLMGAENAFVGEDVVRGPLDTFIMPLVGATDETFAADDAVATTTSLTFVLNDPAPVGAPGETPGTPDIFFFDAPAPIDDAPLSEPAVRSDLAPHVFAARDFLFGDDRSTADWWNDAFFLPAKVLRARR